ncbi:unnamed protein product [Lepeophtheirus salmonis]|uniref:(salmon louse) hypothetical protein n=1 Tax=Lepeophtheirus salmonis TaxID=72036 RepID=A0A7R8CDT4_LEPSM|nr:unnamed protein product [Lepeophtheirus salmonis]CAF2789731.1 unnamed protein product [Lepeophtheirus salmonis]
MSQFVNQNQNDAVINRKRRRRTKRFENPKNIGSFEKFCNCTSLHGWKYLTTGMNKTLRNGWIGVVFASMGVATFFLGYSINDFLSSTVQTTQDTSRASLDQVYFPSVTLSNVLAQAYFGLKGNFSSAELEEIKLVFLNRGSDEKGLLWKEKVKNVERYTDFLPFFGTDYGLCSLIKPQISFNKSLIDIPFDTLMRNFTKDIRPGIQLGKENGLNTSPGCRAIHYHMDQPIMALSDIDLSPGFVTQLSVTPVLRDTTSQARFRFTPEERGCYFDGELEFKYLPRSLYRYGLSNCLFAATYDQILEICNCVPFFHTMAYVDFPQICAGISLLCMNTILRDIGSHTEVWSVEPDGTSVRKPCLFACEDQSYTAAVTTSIFPNMHTFLRSAEFCLMYRKLKKSCRTSKNVTLQEQYPKLCILMLEYPLVCSTDEDPDRLLPLVQSLSHSSPFIKKRSVQFISLLHRYARENLLLANIYIKDPAVTRIKRDQKLPIIWFVANIGGIMGLCMGCSLVTLFEVFHHILLLFLKTGSKSFVRIRKTFRFKKRQLKANNSALTNISEHVPNKKPFFVMEEEEDEEEMDIRGENKGEDQKTLTVLTEERRISI